jgi:quercetin dioxygenase-like cupin family protein
MPDASHSVLDSYTADGVFVRQMVMPAAHTFVQQHTHCHDHTTMVATGSVDVWLDGEHRGQLRAPSGMLIRSGVSHLFETLEPNTTLYCIHNVSRSGQVELTSKGDS